MAGSSPAEELSIIRPPRSSDPEVTSPEVPRRPEDAASNCLREQSADQTAFASGQVGLFANAAHSPMLHHLILLQLKDLSPAWQPQSAGQREQGMSELLRQDSEQKTRSPGLEILPAAVVDGPEVVEAPRKRPYLQLEMPTSVRPTLQQASLIWPYQHIQRSLLLRGCM